MATFVVNAVSTAGRQVVFDLLSDAPGWTAWAGPTVTGARWEGGAGPGVGAVRRLGSGPVAVRERVTASEPPRLHAYELVTGARLLQYSAEVRIAAEGQGSRITWTGRLDSPVPGLAAAARVGFARLVGDYAQRLARAAADRGN